MHVFITGTDSNIGKTFIAAGLAAVMQSLGYKAGVYKPIQTGAVLSNNFLISKDLSFVKQIDFYIETYCSYLYKSECSPIIAAELENEKINLKTIKSDYEVFKNKCEITLVEENNGFMTPINDEFFISDIAKLLELPILLVIDAADSSISKTILTVNKIKEQNLTLTGIIINKYPNNPTIGAKTLPDLIEAYTGVPILGTIPEIKSFKNEKPGKLIDVIVNNIDIESIFKIKIPKLNITP